MSDRPPRPQAFKLDDPRIVAGGGEIPGTDDVVVVSDESDEPAGAPRTRARVRRRGWGALFWSSTGMLASLALGLALDGLIRDLFARNDWLGWTGIVATALFLIALFGIVAKEGLSLFRLRRIEELRDAAELALTSRDGTAARKVAGDLTDLYTGRAETARGRATLKVHLSEIIDTPDLLALAERELLRPMDFQARRLVMDSARRVSLVTAISPRALVDIIFVLAESIRLIRRISTLYGGRPGALGLFRLTREVAAHLAVTGGIALGDGIVQQILGHGLAARLSQRLGEGIVNGLLTARVGLATIDVCRPLPYLKARPVALGDVLSELARLDGERKN